MKKGINIVLIVILVLILVIFAGLAIMTRSQALDIIRHPPEERPKIEQDPSDLGMDFELVGIQSEDGLNLVGWFIPGVNGAGVMIQHGSPGGRQDGLHEASLLNEAGYSVLLGSFRAHDECEGEIISFGYYEQADIKAWHQYLLGRAEVDPDRIGLFGESMGGGTSILYAANDPGVAAVATGSAFSLTREVVEKFIEFETDLPPALIPILARFIVFWAEREADFSSQELDTESVIDQISPVPVLIIHGGSDDKIGPAVGRQLYEAAAEPKELVWIEEAGHVNFEDFQPEVYREALVSFFDEHLLGD
jgi:fermentation-respiration switch protein FrsA (DUF1100 family)